MRWRMRDNHWRCIVLFLIPLALTGCGSAPVSTSTEAPLPRQTTVAKNAPGTVPSLPPAGSGRGGYYLDDGPGDRIPDNLLDTPDAEPQIEPYTKRGNSPYVVFGKRYTPITDERPFKQRGIGSWYGKKFHGQKTSSGEIYDMYKMTAAHPTLPIPSYARVTNVANGRQVIVRVNDRGPFHAGRIIDLSYTAALKLGYISNGSSELEVERLLPEEIVRIASSRSGQTARAEQQVSLNNAAESAYPAVRSVAMKVEATADITAPLAADYRQPESASAKPSPGLPSVPPGLVAGFYIQFGAYSQATNAEAVRARLMRNWSSTLPPIEVVEYAAFHRLHSGPFANRAEAEAAAQQLEGIGIARPLIVRR